MKCDACEIHNKKKIDCCMNDRPSLIHIFTCTFAFLSASRMGQSRKGPPRSTSSVRLWWSSVVVCRSRESVLTHTISVPHFSWREKRCPFHRHTHKNDHPSLGHVELREGRFWWFGGEGVFFYFDAEPRRINHNTHTKIIFLRFLPFQSS